MGHEGAGALSRETSLSRAEWSRPRVVKHEPGAAPPRPAASAPAASMRRAHRASAPCECGQCRTCVDNARWERIFQEKFATPEYYHEIRTRHSSPLSGI